MVETLTKAQTARAEEISRELLKDFQTHWYALAQTFLDHQRRLENEADRRVALAATVFALEVHLASAIGSLGRENAVFIARRVLERVEAAAKQ